MPNESRSHPGRTTGIFLRRTAIRPLPLARLLLERRIELGVQRLNVQTDYSQEFAGTDQDAWLDEYERAVRILDPLRDRFSWPVSREWQSLEHQGPRELGQPSEELAQGVADDLADWSESEWVLS